MKSSLQLSQSSKLRIRKLNFDNEISPNGSSLTVCKVKEGELEPISGKSKEKRTVCMTSSSPMNEMLTSGSYSFYPLKSSSMQMFNSFSPNANYYLTQTVCQACSREAFSNSKGGNMGIRKVCCSCKRSRCLKLYCECFLNKVCCCGCKCNNCLNTIENEKERELAMEATLVRNPVAFNPKIARADPPPVP